MSYKQFLRITEGNVQLARQTNAYLKKRDKITLAEWKRTIYPAMKQSKETILAQLKNIPLSEWEISNANRIVKNINQVVLQFENQFKTGLNQGQVKIGDFSADSVDARLGTVSLTAPAEAVLGTDLVASIIPLTNGFVETFGSRMAGIIGNKVTAGLIQGKSTAGVRKDIIDAYGLDSPQIKRLNAQKSVLDKQLADGKITKEFHKKKTRLINKKLDSGSMMSFARAQALAETEMNRASAFAEYSRGLQVAEVNPSARKIWIDQHRPNARKKHIAVENRSRAKPLGMKQLFNVGGEKAQYPRDPRLSAKNVIHCGCTMLIVNKKELEDIPRLVG